MVRLIEEKDNEKLSEIHFSKNAMFYKDCLAFFDAYQNIMEADTNKLPNYIFWNKKYSLEGICLFMKDYASVLGFETLDLSLSYLKTIYYYLASISKTAGVMPEREEVDVAFQEYKTQTDEIYNSLSKELLKFEEEVAVAKANYGQKNRAASKHSVLSQTFNALSIIFLSVFLAIFCVSTPLIFFNLDATTFLIVCIISAVSAVLAIFPTIIFKKLSKAFDSQENGTAYEKQKSKKTKEEKNTAYAELNARLNVIKSEKYECENNLNNLIFGKNRPKFSEILKSAQEYCMLSYNIKRDCIILFLNQANDIKDILRMLASPIKIDDAAKIMSELYLKIKAKDWLYFNGLVRVAYICKYIELAEKTFVWELNEGCGNTPFDVNIKNIAKQQVAFLKDKNSLFVTSTIDKFLSSNYIQNQDILKLKHTASNAEFYSLKAAYIDRFYNYDKIKDYNNIFYDKKIGTGAKVPNNIIESNSQIPMFVSLKLRLLEYYNGINNSSSETVLSLEKTLFKSDAELVSMIWTLEPVEFANNDKITVYECEEFETKQNTVIYTYGERKVVGFKV